MVIVVCHETERYSQFSVFHLSGEIILQVEASTMQ